MKIIKKTLASILACFMLVGVIPQAYADTLDVVVYPNNYVFCNETFAENQVSDAAVNVTGTTQLRDGDIKLYNGGAVTVDTDAINAGIIDVNFGFTPQMEGVGTGTAVQSFVIGSEDESVELKASWVRGTSNTMTDGKFTVGTTELVKFNGDTGNFRYILSNSSTGYVTYDINAKINLTTDKITFKIDETVIKPDVADSTVTVYTGDFDYTAEKFDLFKVFMSAPSGLVSILDFVEIKLDGSGSYRNVSIEDGGITENTIYNEVFPAGSTSESATIQNWQVYDTGSDGHRRFKSDGGGSIAADITDVSSGMVSVTYGLRPSMVGGTGSELVVMHIGPDSSTGIDISMYNGANGTNTMPTAWYVGKSTTDGDLLFEQNCRYTNDGSTIPYISKYDVTVDVDIDAQKAYLSIYMNAQTTAGDVSCYKVEREEIPYDCLSVGYIEIYNTERVSGAVMAYIYPIKVVNTVETSNSNVTVGKIAERPYTYAEGFSNSGNPADNSAVSFDESETQTYRTSASPWNGIEMSGGYCRMRTIDGTVWGELTATGKDIVGGKAVFSIDCRSSFRGITQLPTEPEAVADVITIGANEADSVKITCYYEASKAALGNCGPAINSAFYIGEDNTGTKICDFSDGIWYTVRVEIDMDANTYDVIILDTDGLVVGSISDLEYNFDSLGYWKVVNNLVAGRETWSEDKQKNVGRVNGDVGCDTLIDNVCIGVGGYDGVILETAVAYDSEGNAVYLDDENAAISSDIDRIELIFDAPMSGTDVSDYIVIEDAEYTINLDGNTYEIVFNKMLDSLAEYTLYISPELKVVTGNAWGIEESFTFTTISAGVRSEAVEVYDGSSLITSISEWNDASAPLIKGCVFNPTGEALEVGFLVVSYKNNSLIGIDYITFEADANYNTCNFVHPANKVADADKIAIYTLNSFVGMIPLNEGTIID